jgi:predicted kinase
MDRCGPSKNGSNFQPGLIRQAGLRAIPDKTAPTGALRLDCPMLQATLHMMCGKIAAGKSTLTAELSREPSTVVMSEDFWLNRLFGPEMTDVADYVRCSRRLREAVGPHIQDLLRLGVSVALDFPANTVAARAWMRSLFEGAGADHRLHFLDVPDEVCRARLRARNAAGSHDFAASDAEFDEITSYFVPPSKGEGFKVFRRSA